MGGNLEIVSGLVNEITPAWVALAIDAVMNFFDYFMIWLVVIGRAAEPPARKMCLHIWIGASHGLLQTQTLITCVKNFRKSGLSKGFVGLSCAIMTVLPCSSWK